MKILVASLATALLMTGPALAQGNCSNVNDPACSKSPWAPVGREAILGAVALPPEPSVDYSGPLVIGQVLPETVMVYPVPQYDDYAYTVVGPRRIIIERRTRHIVRLID